MAQAEPQMALGEEKIKFLDASVRDSFSLLRQSDFHSTEDESMSGRGDDIPEKEGVVWDRAGCAL